MALSFARVIILAVRNHAIADPIVERGEEMGLRPIRRLFPSRVRQMNDGAGGQLFGQDEKYVIAIAARCHRANLLFFQRVRRSKLPFEFRCGIRSGSVIDRLPRTP